MVTPQRDEPFLPGSGFCWPGTSRLDLKQSKARPPEEAGNQTLGKRMSLLREMLKTKKENLSYIEPQMETGTWYVRKGATGDGRGIVNAPIPQSDTPLYTDCFGGVYLLIMRVTERIGLAEWSVEVILLAHLRASLTKSGQVWSVTLLLLSDIQTFPNASQL